MTIFVINVLLQIFNYTNIFREARSDITADTEIDEFCKVHLFEEAKNKKNNITL